MATDRYVVAFQATGVSDVTGAFDKLSRSAVTTADVMRQLRELLVIRGAFEVAGGIAEMVDQYALLQNKVKVVTNNVQEQNAVFGALVNVANETRTSLEDTGTLFFRLTNSTHGLGLNFKDLTGFTKEFNEIVQVSGASTQEISNVIKDLSHAFGAGELSGRQLRAVIQQLPVLGNIIGKEFGKTGSQLLAFAQANPHIITTQKVLDALRKSAEEVDKQFLATTPTIASSFQIIKNSLVTTVGGILDNQNAFRGFFDIAKAVADQMPNIAKGFGVLLAAMAPAAFKLAFDTIVGGIRAITIAAAANPFLALVSALVATVAAIEAFGDKIQISGIVTLKDEFNGLVDTIQQYVIPAWTAVRTAVGGALDWISQRLGAVDFSSQWQNILSVTAGFVNGFVAVLAAIPDEWGAIWNNIGPAAEEAIVKSTNSILSGLTAMVQAVNDFFLQPVNSGLAILLGLQQPEPIVLQAPQITVPPELEGAGDRLAKALGDAVKAHSADYVGDFFGEVDRQAQREAFVRKAKADAARLNEGNLLGTPKGDSQGSVDEIDKLKGKLKSLLESISPLIKESLTLADAQKAIAAGAKEISAAGLTQEEVMRRVERQVIGAGNALTDADEKLQLFHKALNDKAIDQNEFDKLSKSVYGYSTAAEDAKQKQELLLEGLKKGVATVDEFNSEWQKLQANILLAANPQDPFAGLKAGLLELQSDYEDTAKSMAASVKKAFDGISDQLTSLVVTGKADFASLAKSIETDLVNMAIKSQIEAPFLNLLNGALGQGGKSGGSSGSELAGLFSSGSGATSDTANLSSGGGGGSSGGWASAIGSLIGSAFADGGEFQVGGQGGTDSQLVAFKASPDETVSVTKPGQKQAPVSQKTEVHLHIYGVQDADSFQRSRSQVEAAVGVGINRSIQRNTQAKSRQGRQ